MPGVMSPAGEGLAGPLTEKIVSRFFFIFFFLPSSGYLVDVGVELSVSTEAPQCQDPVLSGPGPV